MILLLLYIHLDSFASYEIGPVNCLPNWESPPLLSSALTVAWSPYHEMGAIYHKAAHHACPPRHWTIKSLIKRLSLGYPWGGHWLAYEYANLVTSRPFFRPLFRLINRSRHPAETESNWLTYWHIELRYQLSKNLMEHNGEKQYPA